MTTNKELKKLGLIPKASHMESMKLIALFNMAFLVGLIVGRFI